MKPTIQGTTRIVYRPAVCAVAGALLMVHGGMPATAAPRVQLNGNMMPASMAPVLRGNRVMVPMRSIFEALGAQVRWNSLTREIAAQHGSASINLQIGNRDAMVNGTRVRLDQSPVLTRNRTLVPLRFVAEGLGADVHWNNALQLASISTRGTAGQPGGMAGGGTNAVNIPANIVLPVRMEAGLSSADARAGDVFTARVVSRVSGDAEFPAGTRIEGVVQRVQRRRANNPGLLDVQFRAALLPDGTRIPLRGEPVGLDDDSVQENAQRRLMARAPMVSGKQMAFAGVGRGGVGYVLGTVQHTNNAISSVRGPRGNVLYQRNVNRNLIAQAVVPQGAEFGVRVINSISFRDTSGFRLDREQFLQGR
jgi:hypothetical protein